MNYLTPLQMPVSAFLANNYAVCDPWFASAPTQTYANRSFALCAAPGVDHNGKYSLIDDLQYITDARAPIPSLPGQLDAVFGSTGEGPFWKVYFQDYSVAVPTVQEVAAASHHNVNLATFDDSDWGAAKPKQLTSTTSRFVEDLQAGGGMSPPGGVASGGGDMIVAPEEPLLFIRDSLSAGYVRWTYHVNDAAPSAGPRLCGAW